MKKRAIKTYLRQSDARLMPALEIIVAWKAGLRAFLTARSSAGEADLVMQKINKLADNPWRLDFFFRKEISLLMLRIWVAAGEQDVIRPQSVLFVIDHQNMAYSLTDPWRRYKILSRLGVELPDPPGPRPRKPKPRARPAPKLKA